MPASKIRVLARATGSGRHTLFPLMQKLPTVLESHDSSRKLHPARRDSRMTAADGAAERPTRWWPYFLFFASIVFTLAVLPALLPSLPTPPVVLLLLPLGILVLLLAVALVPDGSSATAAGRA